MKKVIEGWVGPAWPKQAAEAINRKSRDKSKLTVSFPLPPIWKEKGINGQVKIRITIETIEAQHD